MAARLNERKTERFSYNMDWWYAITSPVIGYTEEIRCMQWLVKQSKICTLTTTHDYNLIITLNVICQTSEKNCKQPEVVTLGDGRSLVRPECDCWMIATGYLGNNCFAVACYALKIPSISITLLTRKIISQNRKRASILYRWFSFSFNSLYG